MSKLIFKSLKLFKLSMKLSTIVVFLLIVSSFRIASAQQVTDEFAPYGKPIVKVFSNFHSSLSGNERRSAMEIKRAYFGYEYFLNREFSVVVKLDIGSPDDRSPYSLLKRYAYFKNAAIKYKKGKFSASFGLIDLLQFKSQEKFWGYRYIYKSFMDEHSFGSSADIGAQVAYKPFDFLSFDITVMNGEGYVQLQADNTYKVGFGITLKPIKDLMIRTYYDITDKNIDQSTLSFFGGYTFNKLVSLGLEYNIRYNDDYQADNNLRGFSFYSRYYLNDKIQLFARYDRLSSNIPSNYERPWNLVDDGTALIGGIQYAIIQQVKVALNYQDWYPLAKNGDKESYIYVSFEYKID